MKIGFIGTGKISSAIVESFCTSGLTDFEILLSPRNRQNSIDLEQRFEQVTRMKSNQEVINNSEYIFVAVRPPIYKEVLADLKFPEGKKIISLIPFSYNSDLEELVGPATKIYRATPLPTVVTHTCPIPVLNPDKEILDLLSYIGQPFGVETEKELHTIWTLTCLISPYYDLLNELSNWATDKSVDKDIANRYVADMFNTLSLAAHKMEQPDFNILSHHAATPGGLNERASKRINSDGAHLSYLNSADNILALFNPTNS